MNTNIRDGFRSAAILLAAVLFGLASCGGGGGGSTAVLSASSGGSSTSSSGSTSTSSSGGSSTSSSSGTSSGASAAELPTLPQKYIDTTYSAPTGSTITVNAGGSLQSAINSAQPGDTIVLQAGATFTGPFTLPNKTGSGWIYIRSSAYSSLPAPGTRVSPANAANMPKILAPKDNSAIVTSSQAHHYRFVGIEIAPVSGQFVYNVVSIGNGETSASSLPHDITFDRCYIHGDPSAGSRRGVAMNGASVAVIDSYISDFKEVGADTQALWTSNSTGPLKIVNNYLEAAGENFMAGGSDPAISNLITADIEIRGNYFFKPLSWQGSSWSVKNLLEFKNAQRILVEGNKFENTWAAAQTGGMIVAKSTNQDGRCTWCVTQHLTIRNNRGINLANGFQLGGGEGAAALTNHILVENNVLEINRNGAEGRIFQIVHGPSDITIRHNTALILVSGGTTAFSENIPATNRLDFRDNLLSNGDWGFVGTSTTPGTSTLSRYYTSYTFTRNAIIGGTGGYPANNYFPSNNTAVGFVNFAGGNYALTSSSPYYKAASDGTDVGANIASVPAR